MKLQLDLPYNVDLDSPIKLSIKLKEIFSENFYMQAGIKSGKNKNGTSYKTAYLYKTPHVRNYQKKIEKLIVDNYKQLILDNKDIVGSSKLFTTFEYRLVNSINRRDLTNFKKVLEDSIVNGIVKSLKSSKFDDSRIYGTFDFKALASSDAESEEVIVTIYRIIT